jgi:hypothetical protein
MNDFRPVTDQKLIDRLETSIAPLLDGSWHFHGETLSRRSWTAVPVEKGRHVEPEDAERISLVIQQETPAPCYALAMEPTGDQPRAYEVTASKDGLLGFSHECAGLNFILVPLDLSFALLFTSEDYNVYAGQKRFVEAVLGTSLPEARAAFHQYADDPWWKGRLLEVYKRYESLG